MKINKSKLIVALRAGLFLFRIAKAAKFAPRIAKGLQRIFDLGLQIGPAL